MSKCEDCVAFGNNLMKYLVGERYQSFISHLIEGMYRKHTFNYTDPSHQSEKCFITYVRDPHRDNISQTMSHYEGFDLKTFIPEYFLSDVDSDIFRTEEKMRLHHFAQRSPFMRNVYLCPVATSHFASAMKTEVGVKFMERWIRIIQVGTPNMELMSSIHVTPNRDPFIIADKFITIIGHIREKFESVNEEHRKLIFPMEAYNNILLQLLVMATLYFLGCHLMSYYEEKGLLKQETNGGKQYISLDKLAQTFLNSTILASST